MINLFIIGHIVFGLYFIRSAYFHFKHLKNMTEYTKSKGIIYPKQAVIATGILSFVGGVGITFWVYPKLALICLTVFLAGVTYFMHKFWKITDPMARIGEQVNFYKNIALLSAILMMLGSL